MWLVTGASRGLGRAIAARLLRRGHEVLAIARDAARLAELAAASDRDGTGALRTLALDLADPAAIAPALQEALHGVEHVHGLVNNAGFAALGPFAEQSEAQALQTLQVNLMAAVQVTHAVIGRLLAQRSGHVINIASDLARRPAADLATYVAAKHGLAGFSHSLLREVKDSGVKVSLVNPGIIDTDFAGGSPGSRAPEWSLRPDALADLVLAVIEQPGFQLVDELSVHPLQQGEY